MFPAYGARTVHMPFGDVYTSVQTGVVEAAENPRSSPSCSTASMQSRGDFIELIPSIVIFMPTVADLTEIAGLTRCIWESC